jgi:two-component system, NarL family, response regulator
MKPKIRLLIVDDHFVVRIGLLTSIKMWPELSVVAEASTGLGAVQMHREHRPDIVLMDLRLPDLSGVEATAAIHKEFPQARIIIISSFDASEEIYRAFKAGARGYLLKDVLADELLQAIKAVYAGEKYIPKEILRTLKEHTTDSELTDRECEVLNLLVKGLSNKEIGGVLGVSERTAKFHVKNIITKLEVADRTEAAAVAFQRGILH